MRQLENQCEVAWSKLQEIEDRIIDEEVEAHRNVNHLRSLLLSDTMKTGLKKEFGELYKKKKNWVYEPSFHGACSLETPHWTPSQWAKAIF